MEITKRKYQTFCVGHLINRGGVNYVEAPLVHSLYSRLDVFGLPYMTISINEDRSMVKKGSISGADSLDSAGKDSNWDPFLMEALRVLDEGYVLDDESSQYHGQRFWVSGSVIKLGDGCRHILFREEDVNLSVAPRNPAEFFAGLGRNIVIKSPKDAITLMKRLKRDVAPHVSTISGEVRKSEELAGGKRVYIWSEALQRHVVMTVPTVSAEWEFAVYGAGLISVDLASKILGRHVQHLEGLAMTICTSWATYKGHYTVVDYLQGVDLVMFDPKKTYLSAGNSVSISVLRELHAPSQSFTDIQIVNNARIGKYLSGWAIVQMKEFNERLNDEEKMRSYLSALLETESLKRDIEEGKTIWSLLSWLRSGRSLTRTPFARRKLARFFLTTLLQIEKLRVAYPEDVARSRYIMFDLTMVTPDGWFVPENAQLQGDFAVAPGIEHVGRTLFMRQPSAPKEMFPAELLDLMQAPAVYRRGALNTPFVFVSLACLKVMLRWLGFADLDDSTLMFFKEEIIDSALSAAAQWPDLGITEEESVVEQAGENPFAKVVDPFAKDGGEIFFRDLLKKMMNQSSVIGAYSNAIVCASNAYWNGLTKEPMLAYSACNLAHVIDGNVNVTKAGGFSMLACEGEMAFFKKNAKKVDRFLFESGRFAGRKDVELVETELSLAHAKLRRLTEQFRASISEAENENVLKPRWLMSIDPTAADVDLCLKVTIFFNLRRKEALAEELHLAAQFAKAMGGEVSVVAKSTAEKNSYVIADQATFGRYNQNPRILAAIAVMMVNCWEYGKTDTILGSSCCVAWTIAAFDLLDGESRENGVIRMKNEITVTKVNRVSREELLSRATPAVGGVLLADRMRDKSGNNPEDAVVVDWVSKAGLLVELVPGKDGNKQRIEALLDGVHYAWVVGDHESMLDGRTLATLRKHETNAFAMFAELIDKLEVGVKPAFTGVDGWKKSGDVSFRDRIGSMVNLVPAEYDGHSAVQVRLSNGDHYCWLPQIEVAMFQHLFGTGKLVQAEVKAKSDWSVSLVVA